MLDGDGDRGLANLSESGRRRQCTENLNLQWPELVAITPSLATSEPINVT